MTGLVCYFYCLLRLSYDKFRYKDMCFCLISRTMIAMKYVFKVYKKAHMLLNFFLPVFLCTVSFSLEAILSNFYLNANQIFNITFLFLLLMHFRSAEDANVFLVNDFQSTLQVRVMQYSCEVCLVFATA